MPVHFAHGQQASPVPTPGSPRSAVAGSLRSADMTAALHASAADAMEALHSSAFDAAKDDAYIAAMTALRPYSQLVDAAKGDAYMVALTALGPYSQLGGADEQDVGENSKAGWDDLWMDRAQAAQTLRAPSISASSAVSPTANGMRPQVEVVSRTAAKATAGTQGSEAGDAAYIDGLLLAHGFTAGSTPPMGAGTPPRMRARSPSLRAAREEFKGAEGRAAASKASMVSLQKASSSADATLAKKVKAYDAAKKSHLEDQVAANVPSNVSLDGPSNVPSNVPPKKSHLEDQFVHEGVTAGMRAGSPLSRANSPLLRADSQSKRTREVNGTGTAAADTSSSLSEAQQPKTENAIPPPYAWQVKVTDTTAARGGAAGHFTDSPQHEDTLMQAIHCLTLKC